MDEVKITDLINEKNSSSSSGFDLKGILDTVKTLAELKKTTASFQQQQQPQQQKQQVIPVQAKIDKNVRAVTQRYEQELNNLRQQLRQQQTQKKEVSNNDNDILKILRGVNMDSEKIAVILDFIIDEKGDLKISELDKLIDKTTNLISFLGLKINLSGIKQVKTAIKLVKIMKGDIKLSEVKELLKELKPLIP